ncbi:MAG: hypothetical protein ABR973_08060 [Candidatus Acidiferrales bacterium]
MKKEGHLGRMVGSFSSYPDSDMRRKSVGKYLTTYGSFTPVTLSIFVFHVRHGGDNVYVFIRESVLSCPVHHETLVPGIRAKGVVDAIRIRDVQNRPVLAPMRYRGQDPIEESHSAHIAVLHRYGYKPASAPSQLSLFNGGAKVYEHPCGYKVHLWSKKHPSGTVHGWKFIHGADDQRWNADGVSASALQAHLNKLKADRGEDSLEPLPGQEPERLVRWVESDQPLVNLGHGVQFLHDELQRKPVAFLEGFDWKHRPGSPATVRLLKICPTSITANHWSEIIQSTREAVLVFLSNEGKPKWSFRHGPIHIIVNG